MSDEVFYLKARMKAARAAVRASKEFGHKDKHYQEIKDFLTDLAENLADQRPDDFEDAFAFVVRTMGVIAQQHAADAYKPYGYKNPFSANPKAAKSTPPSLPATPPSPPKPLWTFPVINFPPKEGSNGFSADFRKYSALKMFGYTVGRTDGWKESERRRFLSNFIELDLPPIVEATFDDEYGEPNSTQRLRKVANVIAANANNFYRNNPVVYEAAISDWEDDLMFLKRKYYEEAGLKFQPWPTTR